MLHATEQWTAQKLYLAVRGAGDMKESSFEGTALLCFSYLCLKLLQTVCVSVSVMTLLLETDFWVMV